MHANFLTVAGLLLALIDFFGLSQAINATVDRTTRAIFRSTSEFAGSDRYWKLIRILGAAGAVLVLILSVLLLAKGDSSPEFWPGIFLVWVLLGLAALAIFARPVVSFAGLALIVLTAPFRLLARARRGTVATIGLILAVVSLWA